MITVLEMAKIGYLKTRVQVCDIQHVVQCAALTFHPCGLMPSVENIRARIGADLDFGIICFLIYSRCPVPYHPRRFVSPDSGQVLISARFLAYPIREKFNTF